jgi:hypothetical protein
VLMIREEAPCALAEVVQYACKSVHVAFAPEEGKPCSSDHVSLGWGLVNRHPQVWFVGKEGLSVAFYVVLGQ